MPIVPLPDITSQYVDTDTGRPTKDFFNWLRNIKSAAFHKEADFVPLPPLAPAATTFLLDVYLAAATQTVTAGAWVKILPDTVATDTESRWDATNHRYVPQTAGLYFVTGSVYSPASGGGSIIVKNALGLQYSLLTGAGIGNCCCIVPMNGTTDYIELWGYAGGATTINGGSNTIAPFGHLTSMQITRLP